MLDLTFCQLRHLQSVHTSTRPWKLKNKSDISVKVPHWVSTKAIVAGSEIRTFRTQHGTRERVSCLPDAMNARGYFIFDASENRLHVRSKRNSACAQNNFYVLRCQRTVLYCRLHIYLFWCFMLPYLLSSFTRQSKTPKMTALTHENFDRLFRRYHSLSLRICLLLTSSSWYV